MLPGMRTSNHTTVSFTAMADGTQQDYELLERREAESNQRLPDRLLAAVQALQHSLTGHQVTRYEHSLQSATRALRDGRDEEYVVAALLHDIGDELAPHTHSEMTGAVLRPFVRPELVWVVRTTAPFSSTTTAITTGWIPTSVTAGPTTSITTRASSSASGTTRTALTRPTTPSRLSGSSRWSAASARSRGTCQTTTPDSYKRSIGRVDFSARGMRLGGHHT